MKVAIQNGKGASIDVLQCGSVVADMIPYTNSITKESDPMLVFAPKFMIHLSTARKQGKVVDTETGAEI